MNFYIDLAKIRPVPQQAVEVCLVVEQEKLDLLLVFPLVFAQDKTSDLSTKIGDKDHLHLNEKCLTLSPTI